MAVLNLQQFLRKFKENQQLALAACSKAINGTVEEMYKRIVDRTPVGNPSLWHWPAPKDYEPGTLRNSWNMSFNGQQRNSQGQFASTMQVLGDNGLSLKINENNSRTILIYNNQPYAQRVETGWSTQAPQGMMRLTVADYSTIMNQKTAQYRIV